MENETQISYNKEDVVELPNVIEGVITRLEGKKAKEVFVDKEGNVKTDEPERDMVVFEVSNETYSFKNNYNLGLFPKGKVPEMSNLGKFLQKYGELSVGTKVFLTKNLKGYYDLIKE